MLISLIVPCYNEEAALPFFYEAVTKVADEMKDYEFEYLFIDDGSKDKTLELLRGYAANDPRATYISFSRNFGKEAAMYAGFCNAKGDYVAVMDADMQDPPSLLPEMIGYLESGEYDSVATRRFSRKGEPPIRSAFAKLFYKIINKISDADIVDGARDFRLMKRTMVDAIVSMSESSRFSKGIFGWIGFRTKWLPYENVERVAGKTKWSFSKLFKYAMDGFIDFSDAPLNFVAGLGVFMTIFSFIALIFVFVRALVRPEISVEGWASTICIVLFLGGIQLLCIGIIGKYLAKTYREVKHRPHYLVGETNRKDVVGK
ncbi:MAG: glycosyltransferase family 2 protein [Christensenellaceae bacterium]